MKAYTIAEMITREYPVAAEVVEAVERAATARTAERGEIIVAQNSVCAKWIFISDGLLRISLRKGRKEDTLFFGGGGDIFTSFQPFFTDRGSVFQLQAMTECRYWELSHHKYQLLQERFPDLYKFETVFLRGQLFALEVYYEKRALTTPKQRLEEFWKRRPAVLDVLSPQTLSKFVPLKVIAQYLSMTPQMLSILRRREVESHKRDGRHDE